MIFNPALANGPSAFSLITAGIDTLDLGFYVQWDSPHLHDQLERLREEARGTDGIQPNGCHYLVLPSGKPPMYRYHLQYPEGQLYLAQSHELKNHPNVYVSISSKTLWLCGVQEAVNTFRRHVEALGGAIESVVPSRVDLAADLIIPDGLTFDFLRSHLVSKSRTLRPLLKGDDLETLYVGDKDSPIQLRLYQKWKEIVYSGKVFFLDVWGEKVHAENWQHVWRVEGQFRRTILKEFEIYSLEDLYAKLAGLWAYLTDDWASLRTPDDDNSARRSIHPLWQTVQGAGTLLGDPAITLKRVRSDATAPVSWYVSHIAGCMVGFASRLNIAGLAEALRMLQVHLHGHVSPAAFAARVRAELIRLGMAVGTSEPPPASPA